MGENEGSIKATLSEVITALMSGNPQERRVAEQQLDALQMIDGKSKNYVLFIKSLKCHSMIISCSCHHEHRILVNSNPRQ